MSLQGKTAVVTGGGSGIGRACSLQLARDGAAVAVWDLNGEAAAETVRLIEAEGGRAAAYAGDASDRGTIETILGLRAAKDFVVWEGDPLQFGASVVLAVDGEGSVMGCWPESN